MEIASCVFKVLNIGTPLNLNELILRKASTYNLRGIDILTIPKVNSTKHGLRSWRYPEDLEYITARIET